MTTHAIQVALLQARVRFAYQQRLRWRIEKLDGTLRSIRAMERAKVILVSTHSLSGRRFRWTGTKRPSLSS